MIDNLMNKYKGNFYENFPEGYDNHSQVIAEYENSKPTRYGNNLWLFFLFILFLPCY